MPNSVHEKIIDSYHGNQFNEQLTCMQGIPQFPLHKRPKEFKMVFIFLLLNKILHHGKLFLHLQSSIFVFIMFYLYLCTLITRINSNYLPDP